jgi:aspartyl-tRNA(Asn)/glutamyl-tRNA(Gln) amidotransferase subunit C
MTISKEDIKKLADLARMDVSDAEAQSLGGEMDAILGYVAQVSEITGEAGILSTDQGEGGVNVMREDEVLHESGEFSKELIGEFPDKEGDYLKVKKIM